MNRGLHGLPSLSALLSNVTALLRVGFTAVEHQINAGNPVVGGIITPDPAKGQLQTYINGGAHTLAVPTAPGAYPILIEVVNNASAGAITLSGFDRIGGDSLTTTNSHRFYLHIVKVNGKVRVYKEAQQ